MIFMGLMITSGMSVTALAGGDAEKGSFMVANCTICHGQDGNSLSGSFPKLAGQGEKYLLKQLRDIKSGARNAPGMTGQLDALSDKDFQDVAAFYAGQPVQRGTADAAIVAQGETIYRAGIARKQITACTACHLPDGSGNALAGFPALAGQWPAYTVSQLKAFRDGARTNDGDGKMMQGVTRDMSDKEIEAVATYVHGLGE